MSVGSVVEPKVWPLTRKRRAPPAATAPGLIFAPVSVNPIGPPLLDRVSTMRSGEISLRLAAAAGPVGVADGIAVVPTGVAVGVVTLVGGTVGVVVPPATVVALMKVSRPGTKE